MKKVLFIAALVVAAFSANAQVWIGGAAGFHSSSQKNAEGENQFSTSEFSISPEIGYSVNNKIGVGLTWGFGTENYKSTADKISISAFSIAPFIQYTALELGKFQLIGRAKLGFESATGFNFNREDGSLTMTGDDKFKISALGVTVMPFLHYVINDKLNVFGAVNFLSLNFANTSIKYDGKKLGSVNAFNFGIDANNVTNAGVFRIGFIYKL